MELRLEPGDKKQLELYSLKLSDKNLMVKRGKKRDTMAQSAHTFRRNGWQAFNVGDYATAISLWERAYKQQSDESTATLLAEALFRRAVNKKAATALSPDLILSHLRRAQQLRPNDPCYAYHLALALHRQGWLSEAMPLYEKVRGSENAFRRRTAYPMALMFLQLDRNPATAPGWAELSATEQTMLLHGAGLEGLATLPKEAPPFWQGITALHHGRFAAAQPLLQQAVEKPDTPQQQALAHYGLGLVAAQQEDWNAARHHWQTAAAAGLQSAALQTNLAELYHRLAEERLQADDVPGAIRAAEEAGRLYGEWPSALGELGAHALQRQAYQAAQNEQWAEAFGYWQRAYFLDGGSFRLAYNLALVLEKQEMYEGAAEFWRETLRRRPRRADHADAISSEQVSRLWRRTAEAYQKVGAFEEAVQVYRNAVKGDETNLTIRLALAETLALNGQLRAAENELERILQRDPNNLQAMLQLGEVLAGQDWYRSIRAPHLWKQVLQLDPTHARARQLLADYYVNSAEASYSWGDVPQAVIYYREALQYRPDDAGILASLGSCLLFTQDKASGQDYIKQAIERAPTDLRVYDPIIRAWLELEEPVEAERVMAQAETAVPLIPYQFYINIGLHCLMNEWEVPLKPWFDRAIALAPPEEEVLVNIGQALMLSGQHADLAKEYLEKAIAADQKSASAYVGLGIVAVQQGDDKLAEKHWRQAEKLARKAGDFDLLDHIRSTREMFTGPMAALMRSLGGGRMPNLLQMSQMFENGLMDFDEEWDDDEEWDYEEDWDSEYF
jgi:tetratricopeptide (TPR) repeat protein